MHAFAFGIEKSVIIDWLYEDHFLLSELSLFLALVLNDNMVKPDHSLDPIKKVELNPILIMVFL